MYLAALRLMKCTFSYDPQNSDELKLEVGDIVEVLDDVRYAKES